MTDPNTARSPVPRVATPACEAPALWLETEGGLRVAVGSQGLLLGRSVGCGIVLDHRAVSKVHAAILVGAAGPEIVALGRNPTLCNGVRVEGSCPLKSGDQLTFPGASLRVWCASDVRATGPWMMDDGRGALLHIAEPPLTVGGSSADGICVPGWPTAAARLLSAQGALLVIPRVHGSLGGQPLGAGEMGTARTGAALQFHQRSVTLLQGGEQDATTLAQALDAPPREIRFGFLPTGGRLELRWEDAPIVLNLSEQRARLIGALLQPRPPYIAGEFIPDEVMISAIWPGEHRTHLHVNQLVHRLRTELARAGVDPFRVLERIKGGGATRVRLGPDSAVVMG